AGSVPSERLEHAPDSVAEMQAKCAHRHDIEQRDGPKGKARHHVLVHGERLELPRAEPDDTSGEVQKVENDEDNQERAAPAHYARGECRLDVSFHAVSDGSGRPAHARELDRCGDVKSHTYEQDDPDKPE